MIRVGGIGGEGKEDWVLREKVRLRLREHCAEVWGVLNRREKGVNKKREIG